MLTSVGRFRFRGRRDSSQRSNMRLKNIVNGKYGLVSASALLAELWIVWMCWKLQGSVAEFPNWKVCERKVDSLIPSP